MKRSRLENSQRLLYRSLDLLAFYFRRKILGQKIPLLASFKLTYRCNLQCSACPFHHRSQESRDQMKWPDAVKSLLQLKNRGCRIVVFEGGEPFLWKDGTRDLSALIKFAGRYFSCIAVTTNGTFPLNVPADVIWVSLDGLKATHDKLRSNSFDRVWQNLASAVHPKVLVHVTLNRENWREINALAEQVFKLPAVKGMTVQMFYPYGQGEDQLTLSKEERAAALDAVMALKRRGYPIMNSVNRLRAMKDNTWRCHDDILINVDPDGTVTSGCYVKSRGKVSCSECGFTPVAEASGALDLIPGSIRAGWQTFVRS